MKAYEIPEADRVAKGTSLMNVLLMEQDERVTACLPIRSFEDAEHLLMATRRGRVKRVAISSFENVRSNGLRAIVLDDGDELSWVKMTTGDQDVILVSEGGRGIRFHETDVREMGRTAAGVNGIRLKGDDVLAGCAIVAHDEVVEDDDEANSAGEVQEGGSDLLIITEFGYGKRTPVAHFRQQNRYGQGVRAMNLDPNRTGKIVSARYVYPDDEITLITAKGIIMRTEVGTVSRQGRYSQGVRVMEMKGKGDYVASVAIIREGDEPEEEAAEGAEMPEGSVAPTTDGATTTAAPPPSTGVDTSAETE